jgi:type II secretion system protein J
MGSLHDRRVAYWDHEPLLRLTEARSGARVCDPQHGRFMGCLHDVWSHIGTMNPSPRTADGPRPQRVGNAETVWIFPALCRQRTRCEPGRFAVRFMGRAGAPARCQGFTLLEVLTAVMVFAIVLAAASTVFSGALRLRNRAAESLEEALPRQQTLAIIERDLANLVVPVGPLSGVFQTASITNLVGGQSSPEFYTSTGTIDPTSPWADIQSVSYVLIDSTSRAAAGRDLFRVFRRNLLPATLTEEPARQWLLSGVQGMLFYYYDGAQWRDSWDSTTADPTTGLTNNLPKAIKVQLQLAGGRSAQVGALLPPIELVVPIVVQARTNQTQTARGG